MAEKHISDSEKNFSYFEVEIDDNPKSVDVMIGYCFNKELLFLHITYRYSNTMELGKTVTSLAFHSATGLVELSNKECYDYKFKAVYGETLGYIYHRILYRCWNAMVGWKSFPFL